MTLQEVKTLIESVGLPVAYGAFPEKNAPPLPWICILSDYSNNMAADGNVYFSAKHVRIELYSRFIEPETEAAVENVLADAGIYWERSQIYIESEECFMTTYEIEV